MDRPVVYELLTVALLGPLLGTNIRAHVRSELICTDARASDNMATVRVET